jgi:methylenetetrahydrofolate dehydrogenase (NADP+)/methenyltetrahydrofolate cyclohydrolase
MSAVILDGKALAATIKQSVCDDVEQLVRQSGRAPGLAVILVGENPASQVYVRHKEKACEETGIRSYKHCFPDTCTQEELLALLSKLNENPEIDGILVQLPLPDHVDEQVILEAIQPDKDPDGFHPHNVGRLSQKVPLFHPCTPYGVMRLIEHSGVGDIRGKNAVIVGASNIVGRPMALELLLAGCTITVCHRLTQDLAHRVKEADIVVVAVGKPGLIPGEWIKPGALVFDVGINRLDDGSLVGDVDFESAKERAGWITPVPGGVGPMTVAILMENTLKAAKRHLE